MTKVEFYETHLQKLRNELIQDIIHCVKSQKANELSLDRQIVVNNIDDQISETIDRIKADGDVIIGVTFDEDYESDLTEFHNDILLSILRELEEGRFEVFEEDGSEEEA
jgi:gamma-glutamyl-gamma-aminobutyrate hydrolase PuuD